MRLFSLLYDRILKWAQHPHAVFYLVSISFSEAFLFPLPPDLILAPMAISKPNQAWWYATLTTVGSVLGGILGYMLGKFFFGLVEPYLFKWGYQALYHQVQDWFLKWGIYCLFFSGFVPIPYKVFTIASGAVGVPILPFILASLIGRGSRFYLVSTLMRWGGERVKNVLRTYIDWIGWIFLGIIFAFLIIYNY